ncbi:MAG: malto-oligosyltrehalose trehalohydrolase [Pseudomonadota bacterium]|nr:malto-oligosyltrehalose trehalohydrolase [Pseudomonadota bacterium]
MSRNYRQPLTYGAEFGEGGHTRFRLWAPAQSAVSVEINGTRMLPMRAVDDGEFEAMALCRPGDRYRYRLADGLTVPDPASRAQSSDVHSDSLIVDPCAYVWRNTQWRGRPWHETVIYELHVGACGGYAGVVQLLPWLAELGITAVELMPVADFPGARNWGYDGVLPYAPDRAYGTPDQLKALIDEAHGLGLMIFLDVVYNHFGPDGCYLHRYAPQFFRDDRPTPWGPAIDYRREQVRTYFADNALYWLQEYRIDGLRFDAVHAIEDDGWLAEVAVLLRGAVAPGRHIHLILENDANDPAPLRRDAGAGFDAQWNDDFHHALHVLLTGEDNGYYRNFADAPVAHLARCLGEGFAYQGEYSASHGRPRGTSSTDLPPQAFVSFLQNHDQTGNRALGERLTTLVDRDALHAATALLLLAPQIPLLFMGEEWGCERPFRYFTDHNAELATAVRDGRRREFAGFLHSAPSVTVPDANSIDSFVASLPDFEIARNGNDSEASARRIDECRRLLKLRHEVLVPRLQDPRTNRGCVRTSSLGSEVIGTAAVRARWCLADGAVLTIASNFAGTSVNLARPAGVLLYDSAPESVAGADHLPARSTRAWLDAGA